MIYLRQEGKAIRNGFNFYPLTDKGSVGVVIKFSKSILQLRYSKITGKLNVTSPV